MNGIGRGAALEIGCSSGFFLEELKDRGFGQVSGSEPSVQARRMARHDVREHITTGFFGKDLYAPDTFDLVCSFQTLDHLIDPLNILKEIHRIVDDQSELILMGISVLIVRKAIILCGRTS